MHDRAQFRHRELGSTSLMTIGPCVKAHLSSGAFYARVLSVARSPRSSDADRRPTAIRRCAAMGVRCAISSDWFGWLRVGGAAPVALWPFARVFWDFARTNPGRFDSVFMLAAFFLISGVLAIVNGLERSPDRPDRLGTWQRRQALAAE